MKHFLPLILFVLISITGVAQSHRFADTTAQWYLGETENGLYCSGCYSYGTKHYTITGDTNINGKLYQKINTPQAFVPALVRDSAQKVYRLFEDRETLIYDFTKNEGDTFTLVSIWGNSYVHCTVDSVDTVQFLYPRKRMYVTYGGIATYSDVWIEGVGSTKSNFLIPAIEAIVYDGSTYSLRCFYEDDSLLVYTDSVNLACDFDTFAPPSFYFADATAQWNILNVQYCFGPCYSCSTEEVSIAGDTVINGKAYQRLRRSNSMAYVRRDMFDVFLINNLDSAEQRIYDFGMDVGDTMRVHNMNGNWPYPSVLCAVDSVDSVIIGRQRKRMYVRYLYDFGGGQNDVIVEGIGTLRTHFLTPGIDPQALDGPKQDLLCYFEKDSQLFHQTLLTQDTLSCVLNGTWVGINDIGMIEASIHPNPSSSSFTIILSQQPEPNTAILIYNSIGALVKQEELTTSTQQIDITGLPNGMYTYAITKQGARQASGKLVVSH